MTDSVAIIRQHAWGRLYNAANAVAARIGADGEIGTRSPEISTLMDALAEIDGGQWCPGIMPYATALPEPAPPAQPAEPVATSYTADQMRAWGVARAAAAVAREREKIAAMFDANPNAEMFRQDIADAIRKGE